MLPSLRIHHKFTALAGLGLVFAAFSVGLALWQIRGSMLEQKRQEIRHEVEISAATARDYVSRAKSGELSEAEAKSGVARTIRAARFERNNYFMIYDFDGKNLVHPVPTDLECKNNINLKDKYGTLLVRDLVILLTNQGEGFTEYYWKNPVTM